MSGEKKMSLSEVRQSLAVGDSPDGLPKPAHLERPTPPSAAAAARAVTQALRQRPAEQKDQPQARNTQDPAAVTIVKHSHGSHEHDIAARAVAAKRVQNDIGREFASATYTKLEAAIDPAIRERTALQQMDGRATSVVFPVTVLDEAKMICLKHDIDFRQLLLLGLREMGLKVTDSDLQRRSKSRFR